MMGPMSAAPRTRSPRGHGDELREEILDAAEELLVETQSEDAVSIRSVADRVGVTAPSIYRHFEDKASLMFSVCDRQFDRLDAELRAHREAETDPVAAVMACGRAYIRFGVAHPETYRIMFMGHSDLTPEQYRDEVMAEHGAFAGLVQAVQAVADAGRLRPGIDVMQTTGLLWANVHGVVSLRISKPNFPWPDLDEQIDTHCGVICAALFP
jgi:AcrR family transcriptional regulator